MKINTVRVTKCGPYFDCNSTIFIISSFVNLTSSFSTCEKINPTLSIFNNFAKLFTLASDLSFNSIKTPFSYFCGGSYILYLFILIRVSMNTPILGVFIFVGLVAVVFIFGFFCFCVGSVYISHSLGLVRGFFQKIGKEK
jgi:hypothetical protein